MLTLVQLLQRSRLTQATKFSFVCEILDLEILLTSEQLEQVLFCLHSLRLANFGASPLYYKLCGGLMVEQC